MAGRQEGQILVTTGSKEIQVTEDPNQDQRSSSRPFMKIQFITVCGVGLKGKNPIAMQDL